MTLFHVIWTPTNKFLKRAQVNQALHRKKQARAKEIKRDPDLGTTIDRADKLVKPLQKWRGF